MDRGSYQSVKEEIRRSADIVDLVADFVQLRKAGKNYIGLCPFHSEKEPSFTVNRERQMFHCFGCKKGGDIFAFWMAYHHCSFPEAIKDLAEKYNVPLPRRALSRHEKEKEKQTELIFKANTAALNYFHTTLLRNRDSLRAREYLRGRGLNNDVIDQFMLGYAPNKWDGLAKYLISEKITPKLAESAGLVIFKDDNRYYDRFRNRVIFPIFDLKGRPVGFGGRVLDETHPKYLNTPETAVFQKGALLYGLQASYGHMRSKRKALIVEGYMDFLILWSAGVKNASATLGTALTPAHVRRLKGYADEITVIFDSDEAGRKAALRGLPIFLNEGVQARAVVLPEGHDPDSFVRSEGLERFLELLDSAPLLIDFYLSQTLSAMGQSIEEKVNALRELLPSLHELKDPVMRAAYVRKVADDVGVKESVVWNELDRINKQGKGEGQQQLKVGRAESVTAKRFNRDVHLLNLLVHHPGVARELASCNWRLLIEDKNISYIIETFFEHLATSGVVEPERVEEKLPEDDMRNELREALMTPSFYDEAGAKTAVAEMRRKITELEISASIRQARAKGDMEELNALLKERAKLYQGMVQ